MVSKKASCVLIIVIMLILISPAVFAGIGENFSGGGLSLWGSLWLYYNLGEIFNESSTYTSMSINLNPGITFYMYNYSGFYVAPSIRYSKYSYSESWYEEDLQIGYDIGYEFVFVPVPEADNGWALSTTPVAGMTLTGILDESINMSMDIGLNIRAYYFFREQIAFYIAGEPNFRYYLSLDGDGGSGSYESADSFLENLRLRVDLGVGISFFVPVQERVLF